MRGLATSKKRKDIKSNFEFAFLFIQSKGRIKKMVSKHAELKRTAKEKARKARDKGYEASVYKKKKGYGVSVTRKK